MPAKTKLTPAEKEAQKVASGKKATAAAPVAKATKAKAAAAAPAPAKKSAVVKAAAAAKVAKKGVAKRRVKKVYTQVQFHRPKTQILQRKPRYLRSFPGTNKMDEFRVIVKPLTTEVSNALIEKHNTLTFIVDVKANKNHIKNALFKLHKVKPSKINTLVRPDGTKKAFVKFAGEQEALEIANKMGIM